VLPSSDEIRSLLGKVKDSQELIGILKTIEPVFEDWVNEEDSILHLPPLPSPRKCAMF